MAEQLREHAQAAIQALGSRTLACAESLTAGLICSTLAEIPGVSGNFRGGIVCYATDVKAELLGVDRELLRCHGPVHAQVAAQMARGVARALHADAAIATTGVAGPGPADGKAAGTVYVAACLGPQLLVRELALSGDRQAVREGAAQAGFDLVSTLGEQIRPPMCYA